MGSACCCTMEQLISFVTSLELAGLPTACRDGEGQIWIEKGKTKFAKYTFIKATWISETYRRTRLVLQRRQRNQAAWWICYTLRSNGLRIDKGNASLSLTDFLNYASSYKANKGNVKFDLIHCVRVVPIWYRSPAPNRHWRFSADFWQIPGPPVERQLLAQPEAVHFIFDTGHNIYAINARNKSVLGVAVM